MAPGVLVNVEGVEGTAEAGLEIAQQGKGMAAGREEAFDPVRDRF